MDDYLKQLLSGQQVPEEEKPEKLTELLEEQNLSRRMGQEALAEMENESETTRNPAGDMKSESVKIPTQQEEKSAETGDVPTPTALEETAGRRFLEELEREIASLSFGSSSTVVIRQGSQISGESSSEGTQYPAWESRRETRNLSPEGLSRVFERDARRYS